MDIYIDVLGKRAIVSPTDGSNAVRPDFRNPASYTVNLYFLRRNAAGTYDYTRYQTAILVLNLRLDQPLDYARYSLTFRGMESAELDANWTNQQIVTVLEGLPSIGKGNIDVTGNKTDGRTFTFINELAGQVFPAMIGRVVSSTPASAELSVSVLPITADQPNNRQLVKLRRAPLASTTSWAEIGVPATPGWTGALNTAAVPVSTWDRPAGNIVLELVLTAANARSGSDGVTTLDATGRSGADGQVIASPGVASQTANKSDNGHDSFLVAADVNGTYGRKFVSGDIGRVVTDVDGVVFDGTTIAEVIDDGIINAARLSQQLNPNTVVSTLTYTLGDLPSDVYASATGAFTAADVGHAFSGTNIPAGTRILALIDSTHVRLSQTPIAIGTALAWTITANFSNVFTSATAAFVVGDVGSKLRATTVLPNDATITKYISATQIELSLRPTAATTGIAWKVIPARSYPASAVSRVVAGNVTTQEVQKVALPQIATDGILTIQDGYGSNMPIVQLRNPITTGDLADALNRVYLNYGGCIITEVVPGAEWNVAFGVKGGQRLLVIGDTQAIYERSLLNWIVADAVEIPTTLLSASRIETPTGSPPVLARNGMKYIGIATQNDVKIIGQPRFMRMTDGSTAVVVRQKRMELADRKQLPNANQSLGAFGRAFGTFYWVGEEGGEERAGLFIYDMVGATLPPNRTERHQQQRACIGVSRTSYNGQVFDIQLYSLSVSTWVDVLIAYSLGVARMGLPVSGPAGAVIHPPARGGLEINPFLITLNSFDPVNGTFYNEFNQSWSRRRWMGDIWEQRIFYN